MSRRSVKLKSMAGKRTDAAATQLAYHAIVDKGRRAAAQTKITGEDYQLKGTNRKKLQATAQNHARNIALLGWMVRKHLDYVSQFGVHIKTQYPELDKRIRQLFEWHSRAKNIDIARRHNRDEMMRLFEAQKTLLGDSLFIKLQTGQLQAIESDRITNPGGKDPIVKKATENGLILDRFGAVDQYLICNRNEDGSGYTLDHAESWENVIFDGYFDTRFDQTRGVSKVASAINMLSDLYEGMEWTMLKIKLHALFGIAIKRDGSGTYDQPGASAATQTTEIAPTGLFSLSLKGGDSIDTIESKTPASETQAFYTMLIRLVLLCLDIPYTFYDSNAANFSAKLGDRNDYEHAAQHKRNKNRTVLKEYSDWMVERWFTDPLLKPFIPSGMLLEDLQREVDWIPLGSPWLDKLKEIQGDQLAVSMGADSILRVCARRGLDAFQIIDENAEVLAYAKEKNVPITLAQPGQSSANPSDTPTPKKGDSIDGE